MTKVPIVHLFSFDNIPPTFKFLKNVSGCIIMKYDIYCVIFPSYEKKKKREREREGEKVLFDIN